MKAKNPVRTLDKSLEILEGLNELGEAGVTELAEHVDLGVSLVHNHLSTLQENGYVVKQDDTYRLSLTFLKIGNEVKNRRTLYKHGKEEVGELADETGELATMAVEENGRVVDLYRVLGKRAIDNNAVLGADWPIHCTALGKGILSQLPESRMKEIIDQNGLPARTSNTITSREALFEELKEIRERGYAIDDEEKIKGVRCVGAPVTTEGNEVFGAVSVSGPRSRMKEDRLHGKLADQVLDTVNVIELNIRHAD